MDLSDATTLARALSELLNDARRQLEQASPPPELVARVTGHLSCELRHVVNVVEDFPTWEHANLQRGVDAYLAAHSPHAEWFGIAGQGREHTDIVNMLASAARGWERFEPGAVDYATAAIGPDKTTEVISLGLVLTRSPGGTPVVVALRGAQEHGSGQCQVVVLAPDRSSATQTRDEIERLMREHDIYRGQVLSFSWSEHRGNDLVTFLPRPDLTADQVILPDGVLDTIERHVVGIAEHAVRLREHGQHLKRGLLLHGPPGTGKTHTVRYLMGRMSECTVIVMTGVAIRFVTQAAGLARRLQPAILILEDVDLVARDRSFMAEGGNPLLFALLDAMDGVGADADVTFVLTTNRADVLERALADRPGRVDLAVRIPKPDEAGRAALLRLYARGLSLTADLDPVVTRTEGATASFFKELLRRAVLAAIRNGEAAPELTGDHLTRALDEMLGERESLTRSLLGSGEGTPEGDEEPGEPPFLPGPMPGPVPGRSGRGMGFSRVIYRGP
ncbi:AAA family ATPase [Nonomuraea jiangxiensis]|uniref:ATPase family associated with various cellular activities (AAA) n=1 Tax=Nonomuraea jiangxiensis TaxID=633440 RepID=A0A1G9B5F2_9ACTN|nr:AAA family ATPase [Nonomuraea jiangxiensis]SDK34722.1 ATPase family associated with various cellular activities (AAA) [Nonomuraea jiangxiensis]